MAARLLVVASALFLGMCIIASGKPAAPFAFCKVIWLVGMPCAEVQVAIVSQIKAMCSYKLGPVTSSLIQANHTSAVGQTEGVNFTMASTSMAQGCHIGGTSVSAFRFDNSTNYCNLQNVIQGSGLTDAPNFVEYTNEWLCFGFEYSACK